MDVVCYSMLETDLENHQAQLSRFQLQVNSVSEDIESMENKLNRTIMTLKKTLVSETSTRTFCFALLLHVWRTDLSGRSRLKRVINLDF